MFNAPKGANAPAMPIDRRSILGSLAAAAGALLALPRLAWAAPGPDAEILALSAEIARRVAEGNRFQAERIDVFEEQFQDIVFAQGIVTKASLKEACAFSLECGREDAITELRDFDKVTDHLFERLMAIPATTQPGRAAKVRALMVHVMGKSWRGPAEELDWHKDMARALLGEFSGPSAAELEQI